MSLPNCSARGKGFHVSQLYVVDGGFVSDGFDFRGRGAQKYLFRQHLYLLSFPLQRNDNGSTANSPTIIKTILEQPPWRGVECLNEYILLLAAQNATATLHIQNFEKRPTTCFSLKFSFKIMVDFSTIIDLSRIGKKPLRRRVQSFKNILGSSTQWSFSRFPFPPSPPPRSYTINLFHKISRGW